MVQPEAAVADRRHQQTHALGQMPTAVTIIGAILEPANRDGPCRLGSGEDMLSTQAEDTVGGRCGLALLWG